MTPCLIIHCKGIAETQELLSKLEQLNFNLGEDDNNPTNIKTSVGN